MPPMEWSSKIDLGNVLTLLGLLGGLVASHYAIRADMRGLKDGLIAFRELFVRHEQHDEHRFVEQGTEVSRLRSNAHAQASSMQTLANKQGALDERTVGLTRRLDGVEERERVRLERQHP